MPGILSLPVEILRVIVEALNLHDICNLSVSRLQIGFNVLGSKSFCRELVEKHIPNAREASLARAGRISYEQALRNTFQRQQAYARCRPHHTLTLTPASDFLYGDASLCLLIDHALYVFSTLSTEPHIKLDLDRLFPDRPPSSAFSIVHFSHSCLTLSLHDHIDTRLAVLLSPFSFAPLPSILNISYQPGSDPFVIRNDSSHLVVGFLLFSSLCLALLSLHHPQHGQIGSVPLFESGFFSTLDINTAICVEIIDSTLWVLTSQITSDPEGRAPVSYYGGFSLPLLPPPAAYTVELAPQPRFFRIFRRSQLDGPIHDAWTTLALAKSPAAKGALCIAETRCEWLQSSPSSASAAPNEPSRSFYTTTFYPSASAPAPELTLRPVPPLPTCPADAHLSPLGLLAKHAGLEEGDHVEEMLARVHPGRGGVWHYPGVCARRQESERVPKLRRARVLHQAFVPGAGESLDLVRRDDGGLVLWGQGQGREDRAGSFPGTSDAGPSGGLSRLRAEMDHAPAPTEQLKVCSDERAVVWSVRAKRGERRAVCVVGFDQMARWKGVEADAAAAAAVAVAAVASGRSGNVLSDDMQFEQGRAAGEGSGRKRERERRSRKELELELELEANGRVQDAEERIASFAKDLDDGRDEGGGGGAEWESEAKRRRLDTDSDDGYDGGLEALGFGGL